MSLPNHDRFGTAADAAPPNSAAEEAATGEPTGQSAPSGDEGIDAGRESGGPAAIGRMVDDLAALRDQAMLYLAAQSDQVKLKLRRVLIWAAVGVLALTIAAALLASSVAVLVIGVSGGVAELVGGRLWLGQLLTGLAVVAALGLTTYISVRGLTHASRLKTLERYARLNEQQAAGQQHAAAERPRPSGLGE